MRGSCQTTGPRQGIPWSRYVVRNEILRPNVLAEHRIVLPPCPPWPTTPKHASRTGAAARRRLQGDHRAAPAGRAPLVRRDRQGRRAVRGRGPPARAAADRRRRHAGRRGHRPARARLRPPGDDRRPRRAGRSSRSPTRSPTLDEVDYVVITAGVLRPPRRGRLRERRAPARGASPPRSGAIAGRASAPRRSCTSSCASRPTRGVCAEPVDRRDSSLWHETAGRRLDAAARAARRPRRRRRDRRRRLHRPVDGATTSPSADPTLRIAVLEAETAGFGASGRNGGWCSALFPPPLRVRWPQRSGRAGRTGPARGDARQRRRGAAGRRGGGHRRALPPRAARSSLARSRRPAAPGPRPRSDDARAWGRGEDDAAAARRRRGDRRAGRAPGVRGATYTPDCAAIHPARLVRGLADAVVAPRRARSTSSTRVTAIAPGRVATRHGTVRAERRGPGDRGLHAPPATASAGGWSPGLLADHRHRAAARRGLGADRAAAGARRSATTGT